MVAEIQHATNQMLAVTGRGCCSAITRGAVVFVPYPDHRAFPVCWPEPKNGLNNFVISAPTPFVLIRPYCIVNVNDKLPIQFQSTTWPHRAGVYVSRSVELSLLAPAHE